MDVAGVTVHCRRAAKKPWTWELDGVHWSFDWKETKVAKGTVDPDQVVVQSMCNQLHDAVMLSVGFALGVRHHARAAQV